MAYELIYTSAPAGIRQGSTGFCVVACTRGIGARLMMTLEALSAYKPLYPHYAANAWDNPVSRAHFISTVNGEVQHILSRVCFNGVDHTGRSNKLASHLVLSQSEAATAAGGPGSLLLREELFKDASWEIRTEYFDRQLPIPATGDAPAKCSYWEAVTGDAGWGGFLAQSYLDNPARNVYISYRPEQQSQVMMLIQEALNLLPVSKRWEVTFNTYFVNLPAGMTCVWRCCPVDSEALLAARRSPANIVIDISAPRPLTAEGDLINAARTGIMPQVQMPVNDETTAGERKKIAIPPRTQPAIQQTAVLPQQVYSTYNDIAPESPRKNQLLLVLIALVILLGSAGGGVILWLTRSGSSDSTSTAPAETADSSVENGKKDKPEKKTAGKGKNKSEQKIAGKGEKSKKGKKNGTSDTMPPAGKGIQFNNTNTPPAPPVPAPPVKKAGLDSRYSWLHDSPGKLKNNGDKITIPVGKKVKKVTVYANGKEISTLQGDMVNNYKSSLSDTGKLTITLVKKARFGNEPSLIKLDIDGKSYPLFFELGISQLKLSKPQFKGDKITVSGIRLPKIYYENKQADAKLKCKTPGTKVSVESDSLTITLPPLPLSEDEKQLQEHLAFEKSILNLKYCVTQAAVKNKKEPKKPKKTKNEKNKKKWEEWEKDHNIWQEWQTYQQNYHLLTSLKDKNAVLKAVLELLQRAVDEETKREINKLLDSRLSDDQRSKKLDDIAAWIDKLIKDKNEKNIKAWLEAYHAAKSIADKNWGDCKYKYRSGNLKFNSYNELQQKIIVLQEKVKNAPRNQRQKAEYPLVYEYEGNEYPAGTINF